MTIETKFAIGETGWYMLGSSVASGIIQEVTIKYKSESIKRIYYSIGVGTKNTDCDEKKLFKTKEDLINSL